MLNEKNFNYLVEEGKEILDQLGFDWDSYTQITVKTSKIYSLHPESKKKLRRKQLLTKSRYKQKIKEFITSWIDDDEITKKTFEFKDIDEKNSFILNMLSFDQKPLHEYKNQENLESNMQNKYENSHLIISGQKNIIKSSFLNHLLHPDSGIIIDKKIIWTYNNHNKIRLNNKALLKNISIDILNSMKKMPNSYKSPLEFYLATLSTGLNKEAYKIK
ncbi:hypothetical protein K9L67_04235 [Candidatus Woesearchaeota archaeon]|nr:hypothetical protein [Candidatus Woesearchaeota archaeon]MCF8012980.1 hypothetical protein [Candidatus Woesearchaeota archaeon]